MENVRLTMFERKRRKGVSYDCQWRDPRTGKIKTKSFRDKRLAKKFFGEQRTALEMDQSGGITPIDYDSFVLEYLNHLAAKDKAMGTIVEVERTLRQFKEACRPKNLRAINFRMLNSFAVYRKGKGAKNTTVNKCLRTIQAALGFAVSSNYLKENPAKTHRKDIWLTEIKPNPYVVEYDQYQRLLDACPDDKWFAIITIAHDAGLRKGEILTLEWPDIDFAEQIIHVRCDMERRTKGKRRVMWI